MCDGDTERLGQYWIPNAQGNGTQRNGGVATRTGQKIGVREVGLEDVKKKDGKEKAKSGRGTYTDFEIFE